MNGNVTKRMMEREMYMKIISIRSILIRELNFSYNCTKPRDNGEENIRGFYHKNFCLKKSKFVIEIV